MLKTILMLYLLAFSSVVMGKNDLPKKAPPRKANHPGKYSKLASPPPIYGGKK